MSSICFCNRIKFLLAPVLEELLQFNETYILASQFLKTLHLVSCVSVSCFIEAAVVWEIFCLWKHLRYKFQSQFFRFLQSQPIYISRHTKFTKAHHRLRIYSSKAWNGEGGDVVCWANIASFVSRYLIRHLPRCKALEKRAKRRRLFFG